MKKVMFVLAVAGMFAFAACNSNAPEATEDTVAPEATEEVAPATEEAVAEEAVAEEAVAEEVAPATEEAAK